MNRLSVSLAALLITVLVGACAESKPQQSVSMGYVTATPMTIVIPTITPTPLASSTPTPYPPPVINEDRSGCVITEPPAELNLDPWFASYCDAGGLPILGSERVGEVPMRQAYYVANNFLAPIPEIKEWLISNGYSLVIYDSQFETILDIPGVADDADPYGGLAAPDLGYIVTYENDLLCLDGWKSAYAIHELGHAVDFALSYMEYDGNYFHEAEEEWDAKNEDAYALAIEDGLWTNSYMATSSSEYWAEAATAYYNVYWDPDGENEYVKKAEFEMYDPIGFALADKVFRGFDWEPTCP